VDQIKSGLVDMAIAQHPATIGWYGVASAYAHLTGVAVPVAIGTGFTVIDASNVDDPEVAKFIYSE
jgi:ribose transport system substrate-binding protein